MPVEASTSRDFALGVLATVLSPIEELTWHIGFFTSSSEDFVPFSELFPHPLVPPLRRQMARELWEMHRGLKTPSSHHWSDSQSSNDPRILEGTANL